MFVYSLALVHKLYFDIALKIVYKDVTQLPTFSLKKSAFYLEMDNQAMQEMLRFHLFYFFCWQHTFPKGKMLSWKVNIALVCPD